jgi:hypothetical protein
MVHAADAINLWPSEEDEQGNKICPLQKAQEKMPNLENLPTFGCRVMVPVPLGQTILYTLPNAHLRDRGFEAIYLCIGSPFGKSGILVWDIRSQKIRSVVQEGVKYYPKDFPLRKQNCILTDLLQLHRQVGDTFDLEIEEEIPQVQPIQNRNDEGVPREVLPPQNELTLIAASTGDKNKNELHPDHPVPQPAIMSTEGGNQNIR